MFCETQLETTPLLARACPPRRKENYENPQYQIKLNIYFFYKYENNHNIFFIH
jgi:hypothetical protein